MKIYVYKQCFVIKIYQSLTTLDQFRTYKVGKVLIERQTVLHEVNNNKKQLPTSVELNINQIRFVYLPPLHWKIITKLRIRCGVPDTCNFRTEVFTPAQLLNAP